MPLAGSKHNVSVMAQPASGGPVEDWNFTIEVEPVSGIEIVLDAEATIDPGHKPALPVEVRNLGNRPTSIHLDIQATDDQGNHYPIPLPPSSTLLVGQLVSSMNTKLLISLPMKVVCLSLNMLHHSMQKVRYTFDYLLKERMILLQFFRRIRRFKFES